MTALFAAKLQAVASSVHAPDAGAKVDIVLNDDSKDWLIIGFFTPNYRPLSARFAESLKRQGLPHHLFAVERSGDWSSETMRKPAIVLNAMKLYPKKSLILMDVDCIVTGSLDALTSSVATADFSCFPTVRMKGFRRDSQRFSLSSRVMLIRPTAGGRKIMEEWQKACRERSHLHGAERNLVLAFSRAHGVTFSPMEEIYSGREIETAPPGAIITHKSAAFAHGKKRSLSNKIEQFLGIEKRKHRPHRA